MAYTVYLPKETGDATSLASHYLVNGDGTQAQTMNASQLESFFNGSGNGQLREVFGSFSNYKSYMDEREQLIQSGVNPEWWTDPNNVHNPVNAYITLESGEKIPGALYYPELGPIAGVSGIPSVTGGAINANNIAASAMWGSHMAQLEDIFNKYAVGINTQGGNEFQHYNEDGDIFTWNGSSFVKTSKIDDTFDLNDFVGLLTQTAVSGAVGYGAGVGLAGLLGTSVSTGQTLLGGISAAIESGGDPKAILGSILGTVVGSYAGGLGFGGNEVFNSAIGSGVASAVEQGIRDGEIDLEAIVKSGLIGGSIALGSDLLEDVLTGRPVDLGGLIDESGSLSQTLTSYSNEIRNEVSLFVKEYITGGNFWEDAFSGDQFLESQITLSEQADGSFRVFIEDAQGDLLYSFDSIKDFYDFGFGLVDPGVNPFLEFFKASPGSSNGFNPFDLLDEWYPDWAEDLNSLLDSTGGTFGGESGGPVITTTGGTDSGTGGGGGPEVEACDDPLRLQDPNGGCGGCIEGYQPDEFGKCVPVTTGEQCPEGQVYNEITGACENELFFEPGAPCNTNNGAAGTYDNNGNCIETQEPTGGGGEGSGGGEGTEGTGGTEGTEGTGGTDTGSGLQEGDPCDLPYGAKGVVNADGNCVAIGSGTPTEGGYDPICEEGRPNAVTDGIGAVYEWREKCGDTHNDDGTLKTFCQDPEATNFEQEGDCVYSAPNPVDPSNPQPGDNCEVNGQAGKINENGECIVTTTGPQSGDDCEVNGQAGKINENGECVVSTTSTPGPKPGDACTTDDDLPGTIDENGDCVVTTAPPEDGDGGEGGGGGGGGGVNLGGGGGMFSPFTSTVSADPQLLQAMQFPITNYLTSLFGNQRNS